MDSVIQHLRDGFFIIPPACCHDTADLAGIGHIFQWVLLQQNKISSFSRYDGSKIIAPIHSFHNFGSNDGPGSNSFIRCKPVFNQYFELIMNGKARYDAV